MGQSIEAAVKNRITDHGRGWCFTPIHFSDLGGDASIRKALSQLQKQELLSMQEQISYFVSLLFRLTPSGILKFACALSDQCDFFHLGL